MRPAAHRVRHAEALAEVVVRDLSLDAVQAILQSLLERFEASAMKDRLAQALRFIAPLSTRAMVR